MNDLPKDLAYGLRFESPLVDPSGRFALNAVNYTFLPSGEFTARWRMNGFRAPKRMTAYTRGLPPQDVKFEVVPVDSLGCRGKALKN